MDVPLSFLHLGPAGFFGIVGLWGGDVKVLGFDGSMMLFAFLVCFTFFILFLSILSKDLDNKGMQHESTEHIAIMSHGHIPWNRSLTMFLGYGEAN